MRKTSLLISTTVYLSNWRRHGCGCRSKPPFSVLCRQ